MICILKFAKGHNSVKSVGGVTVLFQYLSTQEKNPIAADIIICRIIQDDFFILIMVYCVYSLESPQ